MKKIIAILTSLLLLGCSNTQPEEDKIYDTSSPTAGSDSFVLQEDFSRDDNKFFTCKDEDFEAVIEDGVYKLRNTSADAVNYTQSDFPFDPQKVYMASFDMEFVKNKEMSASGFFIESAICDSYFIFTDKREIVAFLEKDDEIFSGCKNDVSEYIKEGMNRVDVFIDKKKISLYLNGYYIAENNFTDFPAYKGFGFYLDGEVETHIDNISFNEIKYENPLDKVVVNETFSDKTTNLFSIENEDLTFEVKNNELVLTNSVDNCNSLLSNISLSSNTEQDISYDLKLDDNVSGSGFFAPLSNGDFLYFVLSNEGEVYVYTYNPDTKETSNFLDDFLSNYLDNEFNNVRLVSNPEEIKLYINNLCILNLSSNGNEISNILFSVYDSGKVFIDDFKIIERTFHPSKLKEPSQQKEKTENFKESKEIEEDYSTVIS